MAIRVNELGLFEVFVGDEMVARVSSRQDAEHEEARQHNRLMSEVLDELEKRRMSKIFADLAARQEPLGPEFEKVLEENLDRLYEA